MQAQGHREVEPLQSTRRQILDTLKRVGQATVEELAEAVGPRPVTIRHHLKILLGRNLVATEKVRGGPGRPKYLYRLTLAAEELFPKTYHLLADRLLEEMVRFSDKKTVAQALRGMAERIVGERAQEVVKKPLEERVEALSRILGEEGFWARWEKNPDGEYVLYEQECPYYYVARRHPVVCSLDLAMIKGMSGAQVRRGAYRLSGDTVCSYHIRAMENAKASEATT